MSVKTVKNSMDLSETAERKLWKGQFSPWTPTKSGLCNKQAKPAENKTKGDIDGVETAGI